MLKSARLRIISVEFVAGNAEVVVIFVRTDGGWRSECQAIWDSGMSIWCHWRTCVVFLVRLWDSGCGSMRNK
jgi:hypothetical protein